MKLSFDRPRADAVRREAVLEELRKALHHFGGRRFSRHEFDDVATSCKGTTVLKHFGNWSRALDALGADLRPYKADRKQITDGDLLRELARVWRALGHRPSKMEWEASDATYSYTTYKQRFGGWISACAALVAGEHTEVASTRAPKKGQHDPHTFRERARVPPEGVRDVPLKLRLKVLSRDRFKCVLCGRTPALNPGAVLHVDHMVPFAKGGRTTESNLRTLCEQCNWGKGADATEGV
jgi:hypothetical protein